MSKIFNIGLAKTGTSSMTKAMEILDISACHFPFNDKQITDHEMVSDISVSYQFERLDELYPGSKFIFTEREMEGWLRSSEKHWKLFVEDGAQSNPDVQDIIKSLYGDLNFERERFIQSYQNFKHRVEAYFFDRPDDVLFISIFTEGDTWDPLCHFLDKPHPGVLFPHANQKRSADEARKIRRKRRIKKPFRAIKRSLLNAPK